MRTGMMLAIAGLACATLMGCASSGGGKSASSSGKAAPTSSLSAEASAALDKLCRENEAARALARDAKGVLVFPDMIKGGFLVGGFHGEGAMLRKGRVSGYYDSTGASYGLQAGVQRYGYALFFMRDEDIAYLDKSSGWEIGSGPSITVMDEGIAKNMTSTTLREGVYCFFFDQRGLMAGLSLQGSKITRLDR